MKKMMCVLLAALLALVLALAHGAAGHLPAPPDGIARSQYAGWSGVLRLWLHTDWQTGSGSLATWLNRCLESFEARHPGVYIQVKTVSAQTIAQFAQGEINPPDLLVFSPGALKSGAHLFSLKGNVLPGLEQCGQTGGSNCAVPIAMGGYAMACRTGLSPAEDFATCTLLAPADGAGNCAALTALCAGTRATAGEEAPKAGTGMDLGLPAAPLEPTPTPLRAARSEGMPLPTGFSFAESAYSTFARKEADAILATQRELCQLAAASDAGTAPDWTAYTGEPFTDQLALFAIVDWPREDIEARRALGEELLAHLLSEESQAQLTRVRALRTTPGEALYGAQNGMAQLEAAYLNARILAPNAFDARWQDKAQTIFALFAEGRISASTAYARLAAALAR